jgi:hypothetical protein
MHSVEIDDDLLFWYFDCCRNLRAALEEEAEPPTSAEPQAKPDEQE